MRKPQRKQRQPVRKPKPRGPEIVYGDDGCEELPPKRKRAGKPRAPAR